MMCQARLIGMIGNGNADLYFFYEYARATDRSPSHRRLLPCTLQHHRLPIATPSCQPSPARHVVQPRRAPRSTFRAFRDCTPRRYAAASTGLLLQCRQAELAIKAVPQGACRFLGTQKRCPGEIAVASSQERKTLPEDHV